MVSFSIQFDFSILDAMKIDLTESKRFAILLEMKGRCKMLKTGYEKLYKIVRFWSPDHERPNKVMLRGLTLEEAQEHCKDPSTAKKGVYFDGYTEQ